MLKDKNGKEFKIGQIVKHGGFGLLEAQVKNVRQLPPSIDIVTSNGYEATWQELFPIEITNDPVLDSAGLPVFVGDRVRGNLGGGPAKVVRVGPGNMIEVLREGPGPVGSWLSGSWQGGSGITILARADGTRPKPDTQQPASDPGSETKEKPVVLVGGKEYEVYTPEEASKLGSAKAGESLVLIEKKKPSGLDVFSEETRAVFTKLDEIISRGDLEAMKIVAALAMLRGPDDQNDYSKRNATVPVRRALFPLTTQKAERDQINVNWFVGSKRDSTINLDALEGHPSKHYRNHAEDAKSALNL